MLIAPQGAVRGLGVDPDTGYAYLSTERDSGAGGGGGLRIYDPTLCLIDVISNVGSPTGLVVPGGPISYNPLHLTKRIKLPAGATTPTGQNPLQVAIGSELTYSICFEPDGLLLTEVTLLDMLPAEVTFVRATGDGTYGHYDARTHSYTWLNPPGSAEATICLELVCRVKADTPVGQVITNAVTLDTRQTPPTTTRVPVVVAPAQTLEPLHLAKTVIGGVTPGDGATPASADTGDEITYRIAFDNRANNAAALNVRLTDTLPPQVDFVGASDDGSFGRYDAPSHAYTWTYPQLAPGESSSVDLVVRLDTDVAGGARITNTAVIESDNTPLARASVDVLVAGYAPLGLQKTLVSGAVGQPDNQGRARVNAGADLTYEIFFSNPAANPTATQISLVDVLPHEVRFVSADGDRDFGFYDPNTHTYTWRYPSLEPGREQRLDLMVRVDEDTPPDTVIGNTVSITARQTPQTTARTEVVTVGGGLRPLHVTKTALAGSGDNASVATAVSPGDEVTYRIAFDNLSNDVPLENVRVTDPLPQQASFVRADDDGVFGRYDLSTHTYMWSYSRLAPQETRSVDLVVRMDKIMTGDTTIANAATAVSDGTPAVTSQVNLAVAGPIVAPLVLRKTLVSGGTGAVDRQGHPYVSPGATLTYTLCGSNPRENGPLTQVTLVDALPGELSFVRTEGDRSPVFYDPVTHTCTWRFTSLAPGEEQCVNLVVRVNEKAALDTVISNAASIVSQETATTRTHFDVVVRLGPPADVQGEMYFKPDHLYRNNSTTKADLMVVVHLPEGIGKEAISNAALVLIPGNVRATGQLTFGTSTQGKVLCFFDVDSILAATEGYGEFLLRVTGGLRDGRTFACERTIWILKFGGP